MFFFYRVPMRCWWRWLTERRERLRWRNLGHARSVVFRETAKRRGR